MLSLLLKIQIEEFVYCYRGHSLDALRHLYALHGRCTGAHDGVIVVEGQILCGHLAGSSTVVLDNQRICKREDVARILVLSQRR